MAQGHAEKRPVWEAERGIHLVPHQPAWQHGRIALLPWCRKSGSSAGGPGREDDPPMLAAGWELATCGAVAGSGGGSSILVALRRETSTGGSRGEALGKHEATEALMDPHKRSPSLRCAPVSEALERTTT